MKWARLMLLPKFMAVPRGSQGFGRINLIPSERSD
jgi:hypothetical protein